MTGDVDLDTTGGGMHPVFISYASHDAAAAAALVEALEQHGISCWIAPRDVKAGAQYADAIVRAIGSARAVVLVLSQSAISSPHVGREIERAAAKNRPIFAMRIDAAPLTPALEYFLGESQWIEAPKADRERAYAKLIEAIAGASTDAAGILSAAPPRAPGSRRNKLALAAVAALAVAGLAALLAGRSWLGKGASAENPAVPAASMISDKSIAVLPFTDLSEKKDQEYFADGMAEEILDRLAKVPGLRTIGRVSSFQFKGKSADPASVGAALGAAYLLEGSVRREASRVRVTAQLVEARTGLQPWTDHYDSEVTDVLQVQDRIAGSIARAMQIAVEANTQPRSALKSPQAFDTYLRGLQVQDRASEESTEAAVGIFKQSLALDPTFAPAAIALAWSYITIGSEGWLPTRIAFERAREAGLLAQRLDPRSPSPHVILAAIHTRHDWDWDGAERELQLASTLGPGDSFAVLSAFTLAAARGRWDEARQLAAEIIELNPLDPSIHVTVGWLLYLRTGEYAQAEQSFRRTLQIAPELGTARYYLGQALLLQGKYDAALGQFQAETLSDGQLEGSAMALFAAGRKSQSEAKLAEAIRRNGESWPSEIARVYAFRGEKDRAFKWLDRAYELRDEDLYTTKGDPLFKNLEGDPRFKAFLKKLNLPE
jgi:TolB-like protein